MQSKGFFQTMSDGTEIWTNRWMPDEGAEIKGLIQLHHGLAEHSMRYDRLGSVLAEAGYVLNAYDMRGHGKTAQNAQSKGTGMFGKLADKDGFNRSVEDLYEITKNLKVEYPNKKVILFGHSFGSFISQGFIERFGTEINACILCGSAGPMGVSKVGKVVANIVRCFKGGNKTSKMLSDLSFGSYNKRIKNPISSNAWISANEDNVKMYESDAWCGFSLTTSFFCDMTAGLCQIHNKANIAKIPQSLPILFIYGEEDPVGGYGKTIGELAEIYRANGIKSVEVKGYAGDRHEVLNEADHETVERDVLEWIAKNQ